MRDRLLSAATIVREALAHPLMRCTGFPKCWCQGASKLLAKYLVEVEGISYVEAVANGTRNLQSDDPDWPIEQSHFWLEHSGFIIDITADQFDDCKQSVIVTSDRSWHDQFGGQTRLSREEALNLNDYLLGIYDRLLIFLGRTT